VGRRIFEIQIHISSLRRIPVNTDYLMYRPRRKSIACVASLLALSIIESAVAMPGPKTDNPRDSRSEKVSIAGLDLSTADGLNAARERVHQVARRLCLQLVDQNDRSRQSNYVSCVEDAVASAMQQVSGPSRDMVAKTAEHNER
jgi:UrcA family protein